MFSLGTDDDNDDDVFFFYLVVSRVLIIFLFFVVIHNPEFASIFCRITDHKSHNGEWRQLKLEAKG